MEPKKYELYVHKGKPWYKIVSGIVFTHLGLLITCMAYAVVGALILIKIEHPYDESQRLLKLNKSQDVNASVEYLKKIFWAYGTNQAKYNFTFNEYSSQVATDLETFKTFLVYYIDNYYYDGTSNWTYNWVFPQALLFTISIITTIGIWPALVITPNLEIKLSSSTGYGNIYTHTEAGRIFVIFYALIGIPLLLVFMKDMGDLMADGVRWIYR
jgi:hypothetical protein